MSVHHNSVNEDLSLVQCDQCQAMYCMVQDLNPGDYAMIGVMLQDQQGMHYFCSRKCVKEWLEK